MDDYFAGSAGSAPRSGPPSAWPPAPYQPAPYQPASDQPASYPPAPFVQTAPTYPPPGWNPQFAPSGGSGGSRALIIVAAVVGTVIVVGILAAIAIPVFLNQRAKAEAARITVSAPATVGGWTRLTDPTSRAIEQQLLAAPGPGTRVAGVYGSGGRKQAFFSAGHVAMSFADRRDFLAGAESGAARSTELGGAVFIDADPGVLGGRMRCTSLATGNVTVCLFADAGAYGSVTVFGSVNQGVTLARTVREAVEHRV
jgi:hypothetical protein